MQQSINKSVRRNVLALKCFKSNSFSEIRTFVLLFCDQYYKLTKVLVLLGQSSQNFSTLQLYVLYDALICLWQRALCK